MAVQPAPARSPRRPAPHEAWRRRLLDLRETERRFVLLLHDQAVLAACWLGAIALTGAPLWPLFPLWLFPAALALYATEQYALRPHHDRALELSIGVAGLTALGATPWSGLPVALAAILACALAGLALPASRRVIESGLGGPRARRRLLIVATAAEAREVHDELRHHPLAGHQSVGLLLSRGPLPQPFPLLVLGTPAHLPHVAREWAADTLVVGLEALQALSGRHRPSPGIHVTDVPTLVSRLSGRVPVRQIDERWFVEHFRWRRGWLYKGTKRACDLLGALLALALLSPVLALVAGALACDRRAPVLDVQRQLGHGGLPFALASFRTVDARGRRTRLGRCLHDSRLSRAPQLFAVLTGHMSLVGPTPHPVELGSELAGYLPHYERRHLIKPGLTGWAQIRDPFGPPIKEPERVLGFDLFYVHRRSLCLDAVILARTAFVLLARLTAPRARG